MLDLNFFELLYCGPVCEVFYSFKYLSLYLLLACFPTLMNFSHNEIALQKNDSEYSEFGMGMDMNNFGLNFIFLKGTKNLSQLC